MAKLLLHILIAIIYDAVLLKELNQLYYKRIEYF